MAERSTGHKGRPTSADREIAERGGHGLLRSEAGQRSESARLREETCRKFLGAVDGLGAVATTRSYERGDTIYRDGEYGDAFYLVLRGAVGLSSRHSGNKEATLMLLGSWESFGELIHGARVKQHASAWAVTDCEVMKLPKVFVERAASTSPEVSTALLTIAQLDLVHYRELVQRLLPRRTEERMVHLLRELAERFGRTTGGVTAIQLRLSHEELAAMVSATRESVTTALSALRERGIVRTENGFISVLDPAEMEETSTRGTG